MAEKRCGACFRNVHEERDGTPSESDAALFWRSYFLLFLLFFFCCCCCCTASWSALIEELGLTDLVVLIGPGGIGDIVPNLGVQPEPGTQPSIPGCFPRIWPNTFPLSIDTEQNVVFWGVVLFY